MDHLVLLDHAEKLDLLALLAMLDLLEKVDQQVPQGKEVALGHLGLQAL